MASNTGSLADPNKIIEIKGTTSLTLYRSGADLLFTRGSEIFTIPDNMSKQLAYALLLESEMPK